MPKALNLLGMRFGRLTVVEEVGRAADGKVLWGTACDCGGTTVSSSGNLRRGKATSCGCRSRESTSKLMTTHGMSKNKVYKVYKAAKQRCLNSSLPNFDRYGGRGIQFKFDSFEQFYEHIGKEFKDGLQLDRIDNNGHYEPGNVRWATRKEQCNNTARNVRLTFNGETLTVSGWAEKLGIPQPTLSRRLKTYGIENVERVLSKEDGRANNGRKRKATGADSTTI